MRLCVACGLRSAAGRALLYIRQLFCCQRDARTQRLVNEETLAHFYGNSRRAQDDCNAEFLPIKWRFGECRALSSKFARTTLGRRTRVDQPRATQAAANVNCFCACAFAMISKRFSLAKSTKQTSSNCRNYQFEFKLAAINFVALQELLKRKCKIIDF